MRKSVHTAEYAKLVAELRDARVAAGLSQRGLAALLGVPHTWVAKVESGARRVDLVECAWFFTACGSDPRRAFERALGHGGRTARRRSTGDQFR